LKSFKINILKFEKNSKKFLNVDKKVLHSTAKSESEIVFILAYIKMANLDKSEYFRIFHCTQSQIWEFVILHSLKYRIFRIGFLHEGTRCHYLHLRIFFRFF
jgi:hypothetical protein